MFTQLTYIPRVIAATYIGLTLILNAVIPAYASGNGSVSSSIASPEVYGGTTVAAGEATWTVALVNADIPNAYYGHFCGGTLIAPQWVITAAHCTIFRNEPMAPNEIDVVAGTVELTSNERERMGVVEIIRHPDYERSTAYADVALLKLEGKSSYAPTNLVTSEILAQWPTLLDAGTEATVFGWGATKDHYRSNDLNAVMVPLVDRAACQESYLDEGYAVTTGTLCAGYATGGQDACSGDSGGPLMVSNPNSTSQADLIQIGIVSWGEGCAETDSYGVYSSIITYIDWIGEYVGSQEEVDANNVSTGEYVSSQEEVDANNVSNKANIASEASALESSLPSAIFIPVIQ